MAKYRSYPRWINVRFDSSCVRCRSVGRGNRAFHYAQERSLYCEREKCGQAVSLDFGARAFDENRGGLVQDSRVT
jgi:hypothetical protein